MCICKFGLLGFRIETLANAVYFNFARLSAFPLLLLLVGSTLVVVGGVALALLLF